MMACAGKAEFMGPGGSVKDRAALYLLNAAEREGKLTQGGARPSESHRVTTLPASFGLARH